MKISRAVLLAIGLLVISEVVVRVYFIKDSDGRFEYGYSPLAGFVEDGDTLHLIRAGGRRFFPQTYPLAKSPGTLRIMVIGDSVPRGPNLKAAYANQLREDLEAKKIRAEVWNMSVPGFGVRRCSLVFQQALHYHPDLVIYHLNDSNEYEDEREYRRAQEFRSWHPRNWFMKSILLRRLYELNLEEFYWRLLPEEMRLRFSASDKDAEIAASMNEDQVALWNERVKRYSLNLVQTAQKNKVPVLIVAQAHCLGQKPRLRLESSWLDSFADQELASAGAKVVKMSDALKGADMEAMFADVSHLKPLGHQRLAEKLVKPVLNLCHVTR